MFARAGGRSIQWRSAGILACYGGAFALLHQLAGLWSTAEFYSLFFLPAGLRFAFLWRAGARYAPVLALVETASMSLSGLVRPDWADEFLLLGSMLAAPLAYGAAIAVARRASLRIGAVAPETVHFALAALLGPLLGYLAVGSWLSPPQLPVNPASFRHWLRLLLVFVSGDCLPILILSPALLWAYDHWSRRQWPQLGFSKDWLKAAIVLLCGCFFVFAQQLVGFGARLSPIVIAVGIIGALFGRTLAWAAVAIVSIVVLAATAPLAGHMDIELHQQLAAIAFMGFIAGSYADDQRRLRSEMRERDSLVLHSERLKTLRAMSLAVIHELSQPLSTLSLETKYMARLSHSGEADVDELKEVSRLIAEKTDSLSTMLRRLRTFGAASGDARAIIQVEKLLREVVALIAPEARAAGVRIEMRIQKGLELDGQEIELQQAISNLLRNAIAASPGSTVRLVASERSGNIAAIEVINVPDLASPYRKGMGVGKLIVEAVATMHGGHLLDEQQGKERRISLVLPVATRGLESSR